METITTQQKVSRLQTNSTTKTFFILTLLFAFPFFFGGPQLLIGSIVNLLLIFIALHYKNHYAIIPMIMLPSIAACVNGLIFGPFTIFLVYMMPAIWIGNLIFVYTIQHTKIQRLGIFLWWIFKAAFLFLVAYILVHLWILSVVFIKAMWISQIITAMIAATLGTFILQYTKQKHS